MRKLGVRGNFMMKLSAGLNYSTEYFSSNLENTILDYIPTNSCTSTQ